MSPIPRLPRHLLAASCLAVLAACSSGNGNSTPAPQPVDVPDGPFVATEVAVFQEPWALAFLPDGAILVTEKAGHLQLVDGQGHATPVAGVPEVAYGGQGGLGDVAVHPRFEENRLVYLSYAEAGDGGTAGAAVARARLETRDGEPALSGLEVIWRQVPKVRGQGHYAHRLLFGPDGHLWISSGDRQKFDPAQDMESNMGKLLRLNDDGSVPADNPFADQGGVAAQVWALGLRNPLGIDFDAEGRLWEVEMGPKGGDELNLIERGGNYGYPLVSNGDHYDGRPIPDHADRPEFIAPVLDWTPVISPGGLLVYTGSAFPQWQGDAFIPGLSSQALVRVELDGEQAREAERFDLGGRIRAVEQGPDGAIWVLQDGEDGQLLRLSPPVPPAIEPGQG